MKVVFSTFMILKRIILLNFFLWARVHQNYCIIYVQHFENYKAIFHSVSLSAFHIVLFNIKHDHKKHYVCDFCSLTKALISKYMNQCGNLFIKPHILSIISFWRLLFEKMTVFMFLSVILNSYALREVVLLYAIWFYALHVCIKAQTGWKLSNWAFIQTSSLC